MRDVRFCVGSLGTSGTIVVYFVDWLWKGTASSSDLIVTSTIFSYIAFVFRIFVDYSVLLTKCMWATMTPNDEKNQNLFFAIANHEIKNGCIELQ